MVVELKEINNDYLFCFFDVCLMYNVKVVDNDIVFYEYKKFKCGIEMECIGYKI